MKSRVVLPLVLLLMCTILVSVESAPSNVVGYVKYPNVVGLNFIALPLDSGYAMASDVAVANPGMMDQLSKWDSTIQNWVTAADLGGFFDGDFAVSTGMSLLVNTLNTFNFYSMGSLPGNPPSYPIVIGLNSMMVPLNHSELTLASELATAVGNVDQVSLWNSSIQNWQTAADLGGFFDGDFTVYIGMPLMVNSLGTTNWPSSPRSVSTTKQSKTSH